MFPQFNLCASVSSICFFQSEVFPCLDEPWITICSRSASASRKVLSTSGRSTYERKIFLDVPNVFFRSCLLNCVGIVIPLCAGLCWFDIGILATVPPISRV